MKKKIMSFFLVTMMILSMLPTTVFASFSDIQGHWGQAEIEKWSAKGIIQGADGVFHPDAKITRGEMAVILNRVMKYQVKGNNSFVDLDQSWYTEAILKANAANIILGSNKKVRPKDNITREEAVVMLGRAFGLKEETTAETFRFNDYEQISDWAKGYVDTLASKGYIRCSTPICFSLAQYKNCRLFF